MGSAPQSSGSSSGGSAEDIPSTDAARDVSGSTEEIYLDYSTYMARFVPAQGAPSPQQSPSHGALGSPKPTKVSGTNSVLGEFGLMEPSPVCLSSPGAGEHRTAGPTAHGATWPQGLVAAVPPQPSEDTASMAWMNALVGRIFWDFLREQYWAEQVSNKIQKKLSKIKVRGRSIRSPCSQGPRASGDCPHGVSLHQLPYFMNELTLTELDMGTSIPSVLSASSPTINERGKSPTEGQGWLQDGFMELPAQSPELGGFGSAQAALSPVVLT